MLELDTLIAMAKELGASDVHLVAGLPIRVRVDGSLRNLTEETLTPQDCETYGQILAGGQFPDIETIGEMDLAHSFPCGVRTRINLFRQQGALSAAIRLLAEGIPDLEDLRLPPVVASFPDYRSGIVLVTGETGSGKSTTLAAILNRINHTRPAHIITLEDPLEFLHRHGRSIVSQREINVDTESYVTALRAALRQSPDVILLGEMRDYETINIAMTAAETGHLLFSTLHTIGAANTIDRIIDVFPANQQHQIAVQLSLVLTAVISQQLVPGVDGRMLPAFEIMTVTPAIRNMIRDSKIPQIEGVINSSAKEDMISMDASLLSLFKKGQITKETALTYATNPEMLGRKLI